MATSSVSTLAGEYCKKKRNLINHTLERGHRRIPIGIAVDDLRAAKAAEAQKTYRHAEVLGMMTQIESGRGQPPSTAVHAGINAAALSSKFSDVDTRSRKGERSRADAGAVGGYLDGR